MLLKENVIIICMLIISNGPLNTPVFDDSYNMHHVSNHEKTVVIHHSSMHWSLCSYIGLSIFPSTVFCSQKLILKR